MQPREVSVTAITEELPALGAARAEDAKKVTLTRSSLRLGGQRLLRSRPHALPQPVTFVTGLRTVQPYILGSLFARLTQLPQFGLRCNCFGSRQRGEGR